MKAKIEEKKGISPEHQKLTLHSFNGELLKKKDDCALTDYIIHEHSTLYLETLQPGDMAVSVMTPDGKSQCVVVSGNLTVKQVKVKLLLDSNENRLTFYGKELEDNHALSDYNIQMEDTIVSCKELHISVKTFYGNILTLEMLDCDTIRTVKMKLQELEGTHPDKQSLFYHGELLKVCSIYDNTTLHLVSHNSMEVYVNVTSSETITLGVEASDTIEHIKSVIQFAVDIAPSCYKLTFAGRELEDHHTLSDCNIGLSSTETST